MLRFIFFFIIGPCCFSYLYIVYLFPNSSLFGLLFVLCTPFLLLSSFACGKSPCLRVFFSSSFALPVLRGFAIPGCHKAPKCDFRVKTLIGVNQTLIKKF